MIPRARIAVESHPYARNLHAAWDTAVVYRLEDSGGPTFPRPPRGELANGKGQLADEQIARRSASLKALEF